MTDPAARNRILFLLVALLSLAGVIVSVVSLQRHYAKSATAFCDFNQKFSCDIVNRSEYSTIQGIPVAGIGVVGYGALCVLASFWKSRAETPNRLLGAAIGRPRLCPLPHLHRSLRTDDLVHFVPDLFSADLSDQPSFYCYKSQNRENLNRFLRCILVVRFS